MAASCSGFRGWHHRTVLDFCGIPWVGSRPCSGPMRRYPLSHRSSSLGGPVYDEGLNPVLGWMRGACQRRDWSEKLDSTGLSEVRCWRLRPRLGEPACCEARRGVTRKRVGVDPAVWEGNVLGSGCIRRGSGNR
jgi:hypothetical protein